MSKKRSKKSCKRFDAGDPKDIRELTGRLNDKHECLYGTDGGRPYAVVEYRGYRSIEYHGCVMWNNESHYLGLGRKQTPALIVRQIHERSVLMRDRFVALNMKLMFKGDRWRD
jgi:hypothetical protein